VRVVGGAIDAPQAREGLTRGHLERRNPNGTDAFSANDTYHFLAIDRQGVLTGLVRISPLEE
jgi:hypothetical protein